MSGNTLAQAALDPLGFPTNQTSVSGFLSTGKDVQLYQVTLNANDILTASVDTQTIGSGLSSYLRVFNASGKQLFFTDNFDGSDSHLTFQAPSARTYFIGVSASGNTDYDAVTGVATSTGLTHGLFSLHLTRQTGAGAAPDLVGASFAVTPSAVVSGDALTISYRVDNRGGAGTATGTGFQVKFYLSTDNLIDAADTLLATRTVSDLAAGGNFAETFTISQGSWAFADSHDFVGMIIDPAHQVTTEVNTQDNSNQHLGRDWDTLTILPSIVETPGNNSLLTAQAIPDSARVFGSLLPGVQDFYAITVSGTPPFLTSGRFSAQVHASSGNLDPLLTLYGPSGEVLATSDDQAPGNLDAFIQQHLPDLLSPTTYYLAVSAANGASATGNYTLSTDFIPSTSPFTSIPGVSSLTRSEVTADLRGDGNLDLITTNTFAGTISVYLGLGDGTFEAPTTYTVGSLPVSVAVGDFNGDGHLDLAVGNNGSDTISVLLGNGDGTFQNAVTYQPAAGGGVENIVAADFNNDGILDLATGDKDTNVVSILLGNGDGTFNAAVGYAVGGASQLVVGDFNNDGNLDIGTVGGGVLLGKGDGTFRPVLAGFTPPAGTFQQQSLVAGDFDRSGKLDLAIMEGSSVDVFLGNGDGTFTSKQVLPTFTPGQALVVGDFNGDGVLDLATANDAPGNVSVFLGNGDGTFQSGPFFPLDDSSQPLSLLAADFNHDGRLDLLSARTDLTLSLGRGDGTFQTGQSSFPVGNTPFGIVTGDFNGDGQLDVATVNVNSNDVSILLGRGDGTFEPQIRIPAGMSPRAIAAGDFNGDGRLDLAVVDFFGNVTILLGQGDGTFRQGGVFQAGGGGDPAIVVGDFAGNGKLDLAVTSDAGTVGTVSVLLGNGDGTFQPAVTYTVDANPRAIVAGDFNGDGKLDLATANEGSDFTKDGSVSLLFGNGGGTFATEVRIDSGGLAPIAIVTGDFRGDGKLDLAVANNLSHTIAVFLSNGDGTFSAPIITSANPFFLRSLAATDFNNDGKSDLVVTTLNNPALVFIGNGDGTFQAPTGYGGGPGINPNGVATGDFNGDGRADFVLANQASNDVTLFLGLPTGGFVDSTSVSAGLAVQATPVLADLNGDGAPDLAVVNAAGQILFRAGVVGHPGTFQPPVILNPGNPARAITLVKTANGPELAATDKLDSLIALYKVNADGTVSRQTIGSAGLLPAQIRSADLNGDGTGDLVVLNAASSTLSIFLSTPSGTYISAPPLPVPSGAADFQLVSLTGSSLPDIVVTDANSGAVAVFLNQGNGSFLPGPFPLFRAGLGLASVAAGSPPEEISREGSRQVIAASLSGSSAPTLIVTNNNSNSFALLPSTGIGTLVNPQTSLLGFAPIAMAAGQFVTGQNSLDLAILDSTGVVHIFLGDGKGGFTQSSTVSVGSFATGLSIGDANGDGIPDLLVGNTFGDVLVLLGNGDGTFRPFVRADQAVPFVTTNANGDVVLANQSIDQAMSQIRQAGTKNFSPGSFNQQGNGLIGPGAITLADLTNNGRQDLIVANSGSNDILVFMGQSNGTFSTTPLSFAVGTNPVSVTVQDLNGDGIPDIVVANRGSNDVSVLFGSGTKQPDGSIINWTLTPGPRLKAGNGPLGVTVQFPSGSTVPNLLVSNSGGTISKLPGVGNGFFNDTNPQTLNLGSTILQALTGSFVATGTGISQIDVNALTATEVFASLTLTSFNTFNNDLIAGFEDGSLALLTETSGKFAEDLTFRDAQLTDPSALEMVSINGQSEIYATTAGESRVFVFALSDGVSALGLPSSPGDRSQTTTVQPVSDVGVALVATVVTGNSDFIFEPGGDLGFAVGLGETAGANVNALAFLTTLLTGTSGDSPESFAGGGASASADAPTPLNGFISGIEDAMRLFQQRIAGAEASGGAAPRGTTNPADWRSLVDQAYSGFFQSATAMGEIGQIPARVGVYSFQAFDAAMRPGLKSTDGTGGMEGTGFGLQAVLESIQQALRQTSRAVGRSLEGALLPDRDQGQQPVGPMSANDLDTQRPAAWAPRLLLADPDGQPPPVTTEAVDWRTNLAAALVLGGFWQSWDRSEDKRANRAEKAP